MKTCSKVKKYSEGGIVRKKPKVNYANTTADPKQGGKSVTGDPRTSLGPHLYELPKNFTSQTPQPVGISSSGDGSSKSKSPKVKLNNPRQNGYVTGGSSSSMRSKTGNAKKGSATSTSKTCTKAGCSPFKK